MEPLELSDLSDEQLLMLDALNTQGLMVVASMTVLSATLPNCPLGGTMQAIGLKWSKGTPHRLVLKCAHTPEHCWDLSGTYLPTCP